MKQKQKGGEKHHDNRQALWNDHSTTDITFLTIDYNLSRRHCHRKQETRSGDDELHGGQRELLLLLIQIEIYDLCIGSLKIQWIFEEQHTSRFVVSYVPYDIVRYCIVS